MHMKVFMSFTFCAIAKWISKLIYLWTVTLYLENCSLWQVFRDEFQHSVFFSCLLLQILVLYIIGKSKLIKHYTWELSLYFNNCFQHYKVTYFHVLTTNLLFCRSMSITATRHIYIHIYIYIHADLKSWICFYSSSIYID